MPNPTERVHPWDVFWWCTRRSSGGIVLEKKVLQKKKEDQSITGDVFKEEREGGALIEVEWMEGKEKGQEKEPRKLD